MIRQVTLVCLSLSTWSPLLAQEAAPTEFKNPDAKKAKATFDAAIVAAYMAYVADLETALKNATMSGDLDEALKIREAIKAIKGDQGLVSDRHSDLNLANERKKFIGTWIIRKKNGFKGEWTFHDDGTAIATAKGIVGMWVVEADKRRILVHWQGRLWDSFSLPLNPKGTSGDAHDVPGRGGLTATKVQPK